ncbi:hpcH/HpaI aldolase/citrate lyase family protein [Burkholderia sp. MSHR3999]|nr:hpcH/HpaI aldolase/citrate lyase family protein [Burkholderia sp. MSHR3999]
MSALTPAQVLYDGASPPAILPCCDHYAGSEKLMRKSLALQAEMGPVFDITLDCEDGAAVGQEAAHAELVAGLLGSADNRFGRVGARIHDFSHPHWRDDVRIILRAARAPAYITLPKIANAADAAEMCAFIEGTRRELGIARPIPVDVLVETHGALAHAAALAALPLVGTLSFGLMDFVSAHHGAIPDGAMRSPGQFEHPLVRRAKLEIAAACHAHGKTPSHNVTTEVRDMSVVADDARRARATNSRTRGCGASIRRRSGRSSTRSRPAPTKSRSRPRSCWPRRPPTGVRHGTATRCTTARATAITGRCCAARGPPASRCPPRRRHCSARPPRQTRRERAPLAGLLNDKKRNGA